VLIVTPLPLAEARARDLTWEELVKLRKRLRGLDKALEYVVFAQGGTAADLLSWLDEHRAPRPELHFAVDADGATWRRLAGQAGAPSAEFLLLDRHGRVRGSYGADPAEIDRLVGTRGAGELARRRQDSGAPALSAEPGLGSDSPWNFKRLVTVTPRSESPSPRFSPTRTCAVYASAALHIEAACRLGRRRPHSP
jgi:hypothetical protein